MATDADAAREHPGVDPLSPAGVEPRTDTVLDLRLGDSVELHKAHPCGNRCWTVVRLGADIGLTCDGCGRRVLLARSDLERRIVRLSRPDDMSVEVPV
jgi:hypothetical protein